MKWKKFFSGTLIVLLLLVVPIASASWNECIGNYTLETNTSIVIDNRWSNITEYTYCQYGCDNVTSTCMPSDFSLTVIVILFVILMVALMYWIIRRI